MANHTVEPTAVHIDSRWLDGDVTLVRLSEGRATLRFRLISADVPPPGPVEGGQQQVLHRLRVPARCGTPAEPLTARTGLPGSAGRHPTDPARHALDELQLQLHSPSFGVVRGPSPAAAPTLNERSRTATNGGPPAC